MLKSLVIFIFCILCIACDNHREQAIAVSCHAIANFNSYDETKLKQFASDAAIALFNHNNQYKTYFSPALQKRYFSPSKTKNTWQEVNQAGNIRIISACLVGREKGWTINVPVQIKLNFPGANTEKLMNVTLLVLLHHKQLFVSQVEMEQFSKQTLLASSPSVSNEMQEWTKPSFPLPKDAINIQNNDGSRLYVCRAHYLDTIQPGQLTPNGCLIVYGGQSFTISEYEILISKPARVTWRFLNDAPEKQSCHYTPTPSNSFPTYLSGSKLLVPLNQPTLGLQASCKTTPILPFSVGVENNRPIYACIAIYNKTLHIGKLVNQDCHISDNNAAEKPAPVYKVLYPQ